MFFSFAQKELARLLSNCNLISPKKSDVDLFTYTKFSVQDGMLEFIAINPSIYYRSNLKPKSIEINPEEGTVFLIKTDLITSAISLINDELVGLEVDLEKHTLSVQGAKSKHTLRINTQLIEDFKLPDEAEEVLETELRITLDDLVTANKIAGTSVGNPKVIFEPQFLNICYTLAPKTKEMYIVSTDKYRLAKLKLVANYENPNEEIDFPKNYLIHPNNLQLLAACAGAEDEVITLKFCQNYLWIHLKEATLTMRYGSGNFPEYDKIIPQSFACSFHLQTSELLESLRQIYFAARTNAINKTVTISVTPSSNELLLQAKTEDGNSSQSVVQLIEYEGVSEEWSQSFNADYLIDYISAIKTETLLWEANPGKPSVLSPKDQKETQMCLISGLR
jgi:DNA polymerase III sliding clamp (beta) subunit (PCNA family)